MTSNDDDVDPGVPIEVLAHLEQPVSGRLSGRVRNAIRRRHLAGELLDFATLAPGLVLLTYVTAAMGALSPVRPDSDPSVDVPNE